MTSEFAPEIIVALIAVAGVLLSVGASILASRRMLQTEVRKIQSQAYHLHMAEILKNRFACYPKIYTVLSQLAKEVQYATLSVETLRTFALKLDELDSEHAILFSGRTQSICYRFRKMLVKLLEDDADLDHQLASAEFRKSLYQRIGNFELALRSDLGLFGVRVSDAETRLVTIDSLREQAEIT